MPAHGKFHERRGRAAAAKSFSSGSILARLGADLVRARCAGARVPAGRGARRLRAGGDRERREDGAQLRAGRGLRAAAGVDRRAPRGRARSGRPDERVAPGLPVFLAAACAAGPVLVEAPTYDRPLKILAALGAEVIVVDQDEDGLDDDLERKSRGSRRRSSTRSRPSRTRAGARSPPDRRRRLVELARGGHARPRGRSVRPRALRGRGAADAVRARRRRGRHLQLVVLEDDRAGAARVGYLVLPAGSRRSSRPLRAGRTSRRRCSRRRRCTSSCAAATSSRTSSVSPAFSRPAATR